MMVNAIQILMVLASLLCLATHCSAFWFSAEEPKPSSPRFLYQPPDYYRSYVAPPVPYSVPLQVPVPAQLTPAAVQNIQLVPCLCPVSQEYSYDHSSDYSGRKLQPVQAQQVPQQRRK